MEQQTEAAVKFYSIPEPTILKEI